MTQLNFSGPVDVTPELMMALWRAMPEMGQSGCAQLFFSRFVTEPISKEAIEAGAKVFFEREKIGSAGAKALRDGVAEKCRLLGETSVNAKRVLAIVAEETQKAAADCVKQKMDEVLGALPLDVFVQAAMPGVAETVQACSRHYFTKSPVGEAWLLSLVNEVCENERERLRDVVSEKLIDAAALEASKRGGLEASGMPGNNRARI